MAIATQSTTYVSIAETAQHLACSTDTVRRMISRGELRAYRIGRLIRIKMSDIDKAARPLTNAADTLEAVSADA